MILRIGAILLAAAVAAGCGRHEALPIGQAPERPAGPAREVALTQEAVNGGAVAVTELHRRPFDEEIDVLGNTAAEPDQVVPVRSPAPGRVESVLAALGDVVSKGTILARVTDEDGRTREVPAPGPGFIVGVYAEAGGHAGPEVPLFGIGESSRMQCVLDIFEKDISKVAKGQRVRLTSTAFPRETFEGRITYISPRVSEATRTVKARAEVDNRRGRLRFGMSVEGRISVGARPAFILPGSSVLMLEGKAFVFASATGNAFSLREVVIGPGSAGRDVEILSGVREGERVVTRGGFMLLAELDKDEG